MSTRRIRALVVGVMALAFLSVAGWSASAVCAFDPDDPPLTIRQMIRSGTTGDPPFDTVFLGRVRAIRDPGERGGDAIARFSVRAHPVGWAPHRSRVRFYRPGRGEGLSDNFEFREGRRYAVVAVRRDDGKYRFDGECGQTRRVSQDQLRKLLRLTRSLGLT